MLCYGCLFATLGIVAMMYRFAYPGADDFCRSVKVRNHGLATSVYSEYFGWSGRWSGTGLAYCWFAAADLSRHYVLLLAVIPCMTVFSIWALVSALVDGALKRREQLILALLFFALFWVGSPSVRDIVYWLSGTLEYQLSFALAVLLVASMIRCSQNGRRPALAQLALLCALALIATGMHELYAVLLTLVLAIGTAAAFAERHPARWAWAAIMLTSAIGFLIVYFAPGNEVRIKRTENYGQFALALGLAMEQALANLPDWIFDARLLLASLLMISHPRFIALDLAWLCDRRIRWEWVVPATWCVMLAIALFAPGWGLGKIMGTRTLSTIYLIFLLGWFATLLVVAQQTTVKVWLGGGMPPRAWSMLAVLLSLSLVTTGNTRRAVSDLMGPAWQYEREMQERYRALDAAAAEGVKHVRLPQLTARTKTIGFGRLQLDHRNFINRCVAGYFHVKTITIEPAPPE